MHPNFNISFLRSETLLSVGKLEKEANYFAVDLIYGDDVLQESVAFPIPEIAACLNISDDLANYRLSHYRK